MIRRRTEGQERRHLRCRCKFCFYLSVNISISFFYNVTRTYKRLPLSIDHFTSPTHTNVIVAGEHTTHRTRARRLVI